MVVDNPLLEDSGSTVEVSDDKVAPTTAMTTTKSNTVDKVADEDTVATTPQNAAVKSTASSTNT